MKKSRGPPELPELEKLRSEVEAQSKALRQVEKRLITFTGEATRESFAAKELMNTSMTALEKLATQQELATLP